MSPDGEDPPPDSSSSPPALATDTVGDKLVRFGCGAFLGGLTVAFLLSSVMAGGTGLVVLAMVVVALCGLLAVTHGDRFVEGLLRFMDKL
jgi:hypothetical protein